MELDIERVLEDPAPLTGMTKAEFDKVRKKFSGTDQQFVDAAILYWLRPSHRLLGKLTGVTQQMVTLRFKTAKPLFEKAYEAHFNRKPSTYMDPAGKLEALRSRCPELDDFLAKAVAVAA